MFIKMLTIYKTKQNCLGGDIIALLTIVLHTDLKMRLKNGQMKIRLIDLNNF